MARLLENAAGQVFLLDSQDRVVSSLGQYTSSVPGQQGRQVAVPVTTASPAATTSTTYVMAGCAISITPRVTGLVAVTFAGLVGNTNGNGSNVKIAYAAGAAPANGAALVGTVIGNTASVLSLTGVLVQPFAVSGIAGAVVALVLGTTYWFDLQFEATTGGTSTMTGVVATAFEIGG